MDLGLAPLWMEPPYIDTAKSRQNRTRIGILI